MGLSGYQPSHPSSLVYQDAKEVERLTAKLVSSTPKLWAPTLDLLISKQLHTQHKEEFPFMLHGPSGHGFPSSAIQGMQRRKPAF